MYEHTRCQRAGQPRWSAHTPTGPSARERPASLRSCAGILPGGMQSSLVPEKDYANTTDDLGPDERALARGKRERGGDAAVGIRSPVDEIASEQ